MGTFPTAASPRRTSFTLLLGFGAEASAIVDCAEMGEVVEEVFAVARRARPRLYSDSLAVVSLVSVFRWSGFSVN